ncbi:MAG: flagellar motor switch protein FliG [FCB group bacterium]|nr:flagellar motor switch protein FliG [FCB group bacterium]
MASISNITPIQKSALVMIAIGMENASKVMKNLSEKEVEEITIEIARMKDIPSDITGEVIEEYYQMMQAKEFIIQGGVEYAKEVLDNAWGTKKSMEIMKKVEAVTEVSAFYLLQTVDNNQLISFLQNEHPQTVALILAYLKPPQAATILSDLPEDRQAEITYRLATMQKTAPEFIEDIENVLRDQMGSVFGGGQLSSTGGAEAVAEILNSTSRASEKNIMDSLRERDPKLYDEITSLMFLFEDIIGLSDQAIQRIIKGVESKTVALAMKATSDELKEKIFKNMSERAAEMLRDELQYIGPVRVREVEEAQKQILDVVRQLEEAGEITIGHGGEDEEIID